MGSRCVDESAAALFPPQPRPWAAARRRAHGHQTARFTALAITTAARAGGQGGDGVKTGKGRGRTSAWQPQSTAEATSGGRHREGGAALHDQDCGWCSCYPFSCYLSRDMGAALFVRT